MRRGLACSIVMFALLACDGNLGRVSDPGGSESSTTGEPPTGDGDPPPCIGGQLCPEGTSCSNGVCETECSADGDCAGHEFCGLDGLCHPKVVPGCSSDQDCAATQTCIDQLCIATDAGACDPYNYVQDGCPSNAVCIDDDYEEPAEGVCHPMPACGGDQTCPVGLVGAVCNTGQLPSKDEICLIGLCDVPANCPQLWSCVRFDNSVLGECSDGGFGSPCTESGHCISGNCLLVPGVGGGFCG